MTAPGIHDGTRLACRFGSETVQALTRVLQEPVNVHGGMTLFNEAMAISKEANLAYDVKLVDVDLMFVHPPNRSGLGLSPTLATALARGLDPLAQTSPS